MKYILAIILSILPFYAYSQDLKPRIDDTTGKWGFVDNTDKFVIQPQFDYVWDFSEGFATVNLNNKRGYIDKTGRFLIEPQFELTCSFSDGFAAVKLNGQWGYINKTGSFIIQPQFNDARSFSEGLAAVCNGEWGYIDKSGSFVIQPQFNEALSFNDGLGAVKLNSRWGYIDKTGKFIIQPQFSDAQSFSEGLAAVYNGKWGYIDKTGSFVIQPQYGRVWPFNEGVAKVSKSFFSLGGRYIDRNGNLYNTKIGALVSSHSLAQYIKSKLGLWEDYLQRLGIKQLTEADLVSMVQAEIEPWQQKDQFETTAQWKQRVNEQTRSAKAKEIADRISSDYNSRIQKVREQYNAEREALVREYCDGKSNSFVDQKIELMPYDADNQSFLIRTERSGDILLPVPLADAKTFYRDWDKIKTSVKAVYVPSGNDVALQSVSFGKYVYDSNTKADYALVDVDYNFRPIDVSSLNYNLAAIDNAPEPANKVSTAPAGIAPRTIKPEKRKVSGGSAADVDLNIPQGTSTASNTFAVIIANSDYAHASRVDNAANDGKVVEQYFTRTLGIPRNNVTTYINATYGQIASAMSHLRDVASAFGPDNFNVLFYYVGHGLPHDGSQESLLLPVDVDPKQTDICYPLGKLYQELGDLGASTVTVMIDACFSGSNFGEGMLVSQSMGVALKPKETAPSGKMMVLSASQGDETAFPYNEKGHGLFTYYLLKKLQESKGNVTMGELSQYITDNVRKTSVVVNRKPQTPGVAVSPALTDTWRTHPFGR